MPISQAQTPSPAQLQIPALFNPKPDFQRFSRLGSLFTLLHQLFVAGVARYKSPKAIGSDQSPGIVLNRKDRRFVVPSDHKWDKDGEDGLKRSLFASHSALFAFGGLFLFVRALYLIFALFVCYSVPLVLPVNPFL
ncbi:hypothetical protein O95_00429 [Bartonella henselae JK 53]|nr:hypothetical protein O95_00429 [Bartonella henselae JK 53]